MLLEYIALFEELLGITKRIAFNTVSQDIKQQLSDTTKRIIDDITFVLHYTSENGYNISKGKEFIINLMFQNHQKRLINLIEQQSIYKRCSNCGRVLPRTRTYFYRDCNAKDGLRNDCRNAIRQSKKNYMIKKEKHPSLLLQLFDLISEEYEHIIQEQDRGKLQSFHTSLFYIHYILSYFYKNPEA